MTQATQELPPWLSFSLTTISGVGGASPVTSSSLVYLPLTYYGPSIPLGPDWTYGGLTSPASTPTTSSTSTSVTPTPPTTTSPPTTITSSSSSSSATSLSTSSSPSSSSSTTFATPTPTQPSSRSDSSSVKQPGVIAGIVIGCLAFVSFWAILYICCTRRRHRRTRQQWNMASPINVFPPPGYARGPDSPGEGSPRASGEEVDPFLTRNPLMRQLASIHPASLAAGTAAVAATTNDGSLPSSHKSSGSSAASGYGTLLDRPTVGVRTTPPEQRRGKILSPEELRRIDQESVLPPNTDFGPINIPPRLVDSQGSSGSNNPGPDRPISTGSFGPSIQSWELIPPQPPFTGRSSQNSITPSLRAEDPTQGAVLTARRVRMDSISVSPTAVQDVPEAGPSNRRSSWRALGLGGLAGLARFSWLKGNESPSPNRDSRASFIASDLTDADVEAGHALLSEQPSEPAAVLPSRRPGRGLLPPEERPISTFSSKSTGAASGPSIYHDAHSSLPGTPREPLPAVPPRAAGHRAGAGIDPEFGGLGPSDAVHIEEPSETATTTTSHHQALLDVLDIPVPRGMSPFASSSTSRDSSLHSSLGKKDLAFPPGLSQGRTLPTPSVWNETSGGTPSVGSYAANSSTSLGGAGTRQSAGITIDVLEEAPPMSGQSWRSLSDQNKRTTFGLPNYMQTPDYASEKASLHSMRSHLSPPSSRSAGSAPASRRDGSGSQSSRRSGSTGPSLVHSNSISSDGRRHGRGPRSPTLSAFGDGLHSPTRLLNPMIERIASDDGYHSRSTSNSHSQSHSSHSHGGQLETLPEGVAIDGPPKGETEPLLSRPTSPLLSPESVPWAVGLDKDWTAT